MNDNQDKEKDLTRGFELFKLEYQQTADRFENIYKAIWQIFSYMGVLAAGILTFGARNLSIEATILTALTPLLFWFLAIYVPMDSYGQNARKRLKDMEITANKIFTNLWEMGHYQGFVNSKPRWRTGRVIWVFGIIISFFWLLSFAITITQFFTLKTNHPQSNSTVVTLKDSQIKELNSKIDALAQNIDFLVKHSQKP